MTGGGTWAVVTSYEGREHLSAGYAEADAREMAFTTLPECLGITDAAVRDLLPGLEAFYPAGTEVWLSQRVYWRRGQHGRVAAGEPESFARWSPGSPAPWFLAEGGAYVYVVLDDGYASWWPCRCLETRLLACP